MTQSQLAKHKLAPRAHLMSTQSNRFVLKSRSLELDCTLPIQYGAHVMGVLNVTPDSFSDGGLYLDEKRAAERALEMVSEGARLIDIGGASSRPKGAAYGEGASLVPLEEEIRRVLPVVEAVSKASPTTWISVDTFRSEVAEACLLAGAHMINDITALRFDVRLAKVCAAHKAPLVLMHSIGLPGEMPHIVGMPNTGKLENVMGLVSSNLKASIEIAEEMGCTQLLLDPGFGFGKSFTDNLRLMADLNSLCELGWPVLIGVSRKNSVGLTIAKDGIVPPPAERIFASLGVASVGVDSGACILRTHDVQPTVEFLKGRAITLQTAQTSVSYHTMSSIQPSNSKED